jgi:two-component sensor histidine kinase
MAPQSGVEPRGSQPEDPAAEIERQRLLIRDLQHRLRNVFTIAASLLRISARDAVDAGELARRLGGRLDALAAAHELIATAGAVHASLTLRDVARTVLAPYAIDDPDRVAYEGPDLPVAGRGAVALSVILHELATNALKHGALRAPAGRVRLAWRLANGRLRARWTEAGGPALGSVPAAPGRGLMLARLIASRQLGGDLALDWLPEGLRAEIAADAARLARAGESS